MKLVLIESPFKGRDAEQEAKHVAYARACMRDSAIYYHEAPFAVHLLYTQPGVLDDSNEVERKHGIDAGLYWGAKAELTAVYIDFGLSGGMRYGIENAKRAGRTVELRRLGKMGDDGVYTQPDLTKLPFTVLSCVRNESCVLWDEHVGPCSETTTEELWLLGVF